MRKNKRLIDAMGTVTRISKKVVPLLSGNTQDVYNAVLECIANAPTVDAMEVVHGLWKQARYTEAPLYICSECDKPEYKQHRYCPSCGAKMDLKG